MSNITDILKLGDSNEGFKPKNTGFRNSKNSMLDPANLQNFFTSIQKANNLGEYKDGNFLGNPEKIQAAMRRPWEGKIEKSVSDYAEPYLLELEKLLPQKPKRDAAYDKRIKNASIMSMIGEGLKTIMDAHYVSKGVQVAPNKAAFPPWAVDMLETQRKELNQDERIYENMSLSAGLRGLGMGHADKIQGERNDWQFRLAKLNDELSKGRMGLSNEFATGRLEKSSELSAGRMGVQNEFMQAREEQKFQNAMALAKKNQKYMLSRISLTYGTKALADAKKDTFTVMDLTSGRPIIVPNHIYWDIAQRVISKMNIDIAEWMNQKDYAASKNELNMIVAKHYKDYYSIDNAGTLTPISGNTPGNTSLNWQQWIENPVMTQDDTGLEVPLISPDKKIEY